MTDTPEVVAANLEAILSNGLSAQAWEIKDDLRAAASLLRDMSEREKALQAEVARLSKPEWFGDWDDPEYTFGSISDAAGDISANEVRRVIGCRETGDLWITHRALTLDEEGEPDEFEIAEFSNEADAVKCWDESVAALRAAAKVEAK